MKSALNSIIREVKLGHVEDHLTVDHLRITRAIKQSPCRRSAAIIGPLDELICCHSLVDFFGRLTVENELF